MPTELTTGLVPAFNFNASPMIRSTPDAEDRLNNSRIFVSGDMHSFDWTYEPPETPGFFETFGDRHVYKNLEFTAGLFGRSQVSEDLKASAAGIGTSKDGAFRRGMGMMIPFNATNESYEAFEKVDEEWSGADRAAALDPNLIDLMSKVNPDIQAQLEATRNKQSFDYLVNTALYKKQLLDDMEAYDNNSIFGGWEASTASALINYVLLDEDTFKTAGFGTALKGVSLGARALGTAGALRTLATVGPKLPKRPLLDAQLALQQKIGVRSAAALEGSIYGFGADLGWQMDSLNTANAMFGDDQQFVEYSPGHTLAATAGGAALGFGLAHLIQRGMARLGRNGVSDDMPDDITALMEGADEAVSFGNFARQTGDDVAMININTRLATLAVDDEEAATVGWAVSREFLEHNGRTVDELDNFVGALEKKANDAGVTLDEGFLNFALESFMKYGEDATKAATGSRRDLNARLRREIAESVAGSETLSEAIEATATRRLSARIQRSAPDPERQAAADRVNELMRKASKTKNRGEKARLIGEARKLSDDAGLTVGAYYRVTAKKTGTPTERFAALREEVDNLDVEESLLFAENALIERRRAELYGKLDADPFDDESPFELIKMALARDLISDDEARAISRELIELSDRSLSIRDEIDTVSGLMELRTKEVVKALDEIPLENAKKRERVKVFNDPEAKARVAAAANDPEVFAAISTRHAEFLDDLERRARFGEVTEEQMRVIRAIFAQVEPDALPRYGFLTGTTDTAGVPEGISGLVGASLRDQTGRQMGVYVQPGDEFIQTLLHEFLHVGLHSLPGIRGNMIRLHGKLTRNARSAGKARDFLTRVIKEEDAARGVAKKDIDTFVGYVLASPDEFFAEFGSRYILDSKFRRMMLEEIDDPKNPIFKIAELLVQGIAKFIPYIDEFDFGLNKKDTQRFFSYVDQALGFKPIQRLEYIKGRTADEKLIASLSYDASRRAENLGENAFAESSAFKLLDDIAAANAAGDTKLAAKLKRKMSKGYASRKGKPLASGDYNNLSPAKKEEVIEAALETLSESQSEIVKGTNAVVRMLSSNGLSKWINKVVTNQQGLVETVFSKFKEMRGMSVLFGAHQYGLRRIGGKPGPRNLQGAKNWALREVAPVENALHHLRTRAGSSEKYQEINRSIVRILSKGEKTAPKGHPLQKEIQDVLDTYTKYMAMIRDRGIANGTLTDAGDKFYMPLRLDAAKVRGNEAKVERALANHFMRQFDSTDADTPLNYQTMRDALKWFDQKVDSYGRPKGKFNVNKTVFPEGRLPKTLGELTPQQREVYLKALREPLDSLGGRTPVEAAANNYVRRQLGEEGFTGSVKDFNKQQATRGRQPKSHKVPGSKPRRLTQEEVFDNPELAEFFQTDLFELSMNYASTTGFRVHAQDVLDDYLGVKGVSWHDFLQAMEARIKKKFATTDADDAAISNGFEKYHEVLADLSGGLPRADSDYNKVSRYGADLARQAALTIYGSGIGQSIMLVENMWSVFSKVHNPMDLFDNIAVLLKSYIPKVRTKAVQEELGGTLMEIRRFQQHAANRFVTGTNDASPSLHWRDRMTSYWKPFFDTATGKIDPAPGQGGRLGATIMRGAEGLAGAAQDLGLNRYFNEAGWMVQSRAMKREMNRYLPRALKLAKDLQENPITATNAEAAARQFKGRARKAGFGDRWDIARRFDEAGFLSHPDKLRNLEAINKNAGGKDFSFDRMTQWAMSQPKQQQEELLGIVNDAAFMVETEVMKRISEATSLYKPTDGASRTFVGSLMNSMFSFARSFYGNAVLDGPGMPSRVYLGMLSSYMFFEIVASQLRAALNGESLDTLRDRWEQNAIGEIASGAARVPLLGVYSGIPQYAVNSIRKAAGDEDVQVFGYSPYQSAGTGAMERMFRVGEFMVGAPVRWATGQDEAGDLAEEAWDQYGNMIPGVGSLYGEMLRRQFEEGYIQE